MYSKKKSAKRRRKHSMSRRHADELLAAITRAKDLYQRLVRNGYAVKSPGTKPTPLSQPDRWDVAEYLFFEVAAKFEQFCKRTLVLEVQKALRVNRTRAEHMVGSSEDGITKWMGGWAHVSKMKKRATGLLGKNSVFARVEQHLGGTGSRYLQMAVVMRNRVAHGKGNDDFTKMLANAPVHLPANQRQGVSPGMLLAEYPKGAATNDKWFFRLLGQYEAWARVVKKKV